MFATFLFASFGLQAADLLKDKLTAFYISGVFWDKKIENGFCLSDGDFTVKKGFYQDDVQFSFKRLDKKDEWQIAFSAPDKKMLQKGVYKNSRRCVFNENAPGLDITTNSTVYSNPGEFEVLELEYDGKGEVQSFAANFVMNGYNEPVFGSVRFNSSIPVAKRFSQYSEKMTEPSVIYFSQRDFIANSVSQPILLIDNDYTLKINQLPFGGDGIQVLVQKSLEKWIFDFAAPVGTDLEVGKYETSCRYPFHGFLEAGIGISKSRGCAAMPSGYFEVVDIRRNNNRKITDLKLNFSIETEDGEIYEGTIVHSVTFEPDEENDDEYDDED